MPGGSGLSKSPGSSAYDLEAVLARTMPDVLALLQDGVGRLRREIAATLADRHPKDDIKRAIMRLAVTGQLIQTGSAYGLVADGGE